ncbi:SDR family oxidoreductase [Spongiactinospora sp. TRM90649]|uniref:SDR family NAD(P)-dependent oxidoreductase n=1 Tax=Spongiactinospora sp. TRM90649 TaxID=3031114 RepID=UPI0023F6175D|nr:SDR family oxidoreductase [Spongiactinospora sp. TRM90649]MDF5754464.1 SDR family NAD(P)-dependent oxidoreductase [Spongiactinospora sp. TRM90649]
MRTALTDKVVLVTGASAGIGAATAVAYGREGARVALTYNTGPERATEVAKRVQEAGGEALTVHLDLERHETIQAAVEAVRGHWGTVDVLVANAVRWGTIRPGSMRFEDVPAAEWTAAMHANVVGNALLARAVLPGMRARGFGRIVLVSSGIAEEGVPGPGPYGTAKSALHGMARALAWEAGPDGVLVNVVAAGLTHTERERPFADELFDAIAARTPSRRLSSTDDVAGLILYLGSPANGNLTGEVVRDGSNAGRTVHTM